MSQDRVSSVATLFLIGSALVAGDIRVDGLVESTGLGFKFPNGSVQTSAANQYDKVLIVAKSGAPFTTIQAAIDSVTDAPGNRYLVWVGPGVYNERVTMKAGVDIQGSGALTTRITFGGSQSPDTGTVVGATDAELRYLSVENISAPSYHAIAIYNNEASPRLTQIQAVALGGASAYGIYNRHSSPATSDVFASASLAAVNNYGIYNVTTDLAKASRPAMHRVVIFMGTLFPLGTDNYWGIYSTGGSAPDIDNADITVFGGTNGYGVYNDVGSPATLHDVTIKVSDAVTKNTGVFSGNNSTTVLRNCHVQGLKGGATSSTAYGLENSTSYPQIHHSILAGDTNPIFGSTPKVAYSQLSGPKAVFAAGSCLGAYDENFFALGNQCF
jgi:hypothetical protein